MPTDAKLNVARADFAEAYKKAAFEAKALSDFLRSQRSFVASGSKAWGSRDEAMKRFLDIKADHQQRTEAALADLRRATMRLRRLELSALRASNAATSSRRKR